MTSELILSREKNEIDRVAFGLDRLLQSLYVSLRATLFEAKRDFGFQRLQKKFWKVVSHGLNAPMGVVP